MIREIPTLPPCGPPGPSRTTLAAQRGLLVICVILLAALAAPAAAGAGAGFQDQAFSGTGTMVTGAKTESKLWFNGGSWWAVMWDGSDNAIFRLDRATHTWAPTGTRVDPRGGTRSDVLWDVASNKLYIASHGYSNSGSGPPASPAYDARLYRYTYNPGSETYSLDTGFPALINQWKTESLVLAKDSAGKLWATWKQNNSVMVNRTTGEDRTWGTPFVLPATRATGIADDDLSSIVAFGGNKVGIMWSDQNTWTMNFSVHTDGDADGAWSASESALSGYENADDHVNLKADSAGRVYAAVKTSVTDSSSALVYLLVRDPLTGMWSRNVFGRKEDHHTRPIVLLDEENRMVHMLATSGEAGGVIYEKTAPMSFIAFPSGLGTPLIRDAAGTDMNDATSTKQNLSSATGLVVMASNDTTHYYWHAEEGVASSASTPLTADFMASPTSGTVPLDVQFTDQSTGPVTSWHWDFGDGSTSEVQNPTHTYTAPSATPYTVTLTVRDASGATSTKTGTVTARQLISDFTGSPTSGTASANVPLRVTFADQSTGTPVSWQWNFGDGSPVSSDQNPAHDYTEPGTYDVTLTVIDAAGRTDTRTRSAYISASAASTELTLRPSEDAYVRSLSPTRNYGTAGTLRAKDGGATGETYTSYLKFNVSGLAGPVTASKLRLHISDPAAKGGVIYRVPNTLPWDESTITWDTAPAIDTLTPLGGVDDATAVGTFVDVTLPRSAFADGEGTYTFAIKSGNPKDGTVWYSSREGSFPPQLVLSSSGDTGPAQADFTGTPTLGDAPLAVRFADLSSGQVTSWLWDFGDGTTSTDQNPRHTYTAAGRYTVRLIVTDTSGQQDTLTRTGFVDVRHLGAEFSGSPTSGFAPLSVSFSGAASTGLVTDWAWDFGDGTAGTGQLVTHTYASPGTFPVTLTVKDAAGNTDSRRIDSYVTVVPPTPGTVRLGPSDDAYVLQTEPTTNFGTSATLKVKETTATATGCSGAPGSSCRAYLKFAVSGLTGPVTSANLHLYVTRGSTGGYVYNATSNAWDEQTITWNTAPGLGAMPLATIGSITSSTTVDVALPASTFAPGDGVYTLAVKGAGGNYGLVLYASHEAATSSTPLPAPELELHAG